LRPTARRLRNRTRPSRRPTAPAPGTVTSPIVGIAYLAASPAPAFVRGGDTVSGQTLLIIEAMR
jgi:acetyl-CoA carboxylase biotin carboxyl carrier protein